MSLVDTRIDADDSFPRAPSRHRRSSSLPLMIFDGSSSLNSSLSYYSKLPEEPLKLTVVKLDGSSFDIEVMKSATVAELREAVEAAFTHIKVSWSHVWGHFCLCFDGQKLVEERDHIRNYGIRDGDELQFIRHVNKCYSPSKKLSLKRITSFRKQRISRSRSRRHEEKEHDNEEAERYDDDMENGRHQQLDDEVCSIAKDNEAVVGRLFKRRLPYPRLPSMGRTRSLKDSSSASRSTRGFFDNCKRMVPFCGNSRRSLKYIHRDVWREDY